MKQQYIKKRLKELKKISRDFTGERKKDNGYETHYQANMPIFKSNSRNGYFAMWFKENGYEQ